MEIGSADLSGKQHRTLTMEEVGFRRKRAMSKAAARLANLHPHEWSVLVKAALEEEGLTD